MRGYIFRIGENEPILVKSADQNSEEVVSIFAESFELNIEEIQDGTVKTIKVHSHTEDKRFPDYSEICKKSGIGEIKVKLDPEKLFRLKPRESKEIKNQTEAEDYLSKEEWMWRQLSRLSAVLGSCFFNHGGFVIHSGLVEFFDGAVGDRRGVLLGGASGSGKSTASAMLFSPWSSLSDDLTLVVKNSKTGYSAHPFPTWSRILWKEDKIKFKTVKFNNPIPVNSVILIDRNSAHSIKKIGKGEALCLLTELVKQANEHLVCEMERESIAQFNLKYFMNVKNFVTYINCYSYDLKIDETFWKDVENMPEIFC